MDERLRNNQIYGMQATFDRLYADSKNGSNFYHLYEHVVSRENILLAYETLQIHSSANTAGVDGKTISSLASLTDDELFDVVTRRFQNYQPGWVVVKRVPTKTGRWVPTGTSNVEERLMEQCLLQVLMPITEAKLFKHNYGYRPCRSAIHALSRVVSLVNVAKTYTCVDVSIDSFFDTADHGHLMRQLWAFGIRDKRILSILGKLLRRPIVHQGIPARGISGCGLLTGLFTNVYFNVFDQWVATQWERFPTALSIHGFHRTAEARSDLKRGFLVRYGDEIRILCPTYKDGVRFAHAVASELQGHLKLSTTVNAINLKKQSVDFVGFNIKAIGKPRARYGFVARTRITKPAMERIDKLVKERIKQIQFHSYTPRYVLEYNATVQGIKNYFQYATDVYPDLDRLGMSVNRVIKNRLSECGRVETCKEQGAGYRKRNTGIRPDTKVMVVCGIPLDIVNGVKHRSPMNFSQETTPYTKAGRERMGQSPVRVSDDHLKYLADTSAKTKGSPLFIQNRLTRYTEQAGVCAVLGVSFHPKDMVCHHVKMKKRNGGNRDDKASNLAWVQRMSTCSSTRPMPT